MGAARLSGRDQRLPLVSFLGISALLLGWGVLPGLAVAALATRRDVAVPHDPTVRHRSGWSVPFGPLDASTRADRFFTLALAAGLSAWALGGAVLMRLGALTEGPVIAGAVVLGGMSIVVLVIPGRGAVDRLALGEAIGSVAWAVAATIVGATPVLGVAWARGDSFISPTPWYYWNLVTQVVSTHGIPAFSSEWGQRVPFLDDYPGFTGGTGLLATVTGVGGYAAAHAVEGIGVVALGLSVFFLARSLGATRPGSAVGTILVFGLDVFASKLVSFRPEALGYAFALLIPAVACWWFRERGIGSACVLALVFVAGSQVHAIDWLLGGALLAGVVVAGVVGRGWRQRLLPAIGLCGATAATWVVAGLASGNALSGGSKLGGVPVIHQGVDPTFRFQDLVTTGTLVTVADSVTLARQSLERGLLGLGWAWLATLAGLLVVLLIATAIGARSTPSGTRAARLLLVLFVGMVVIATVSFGFTVGWETYVPRRTGWSRLLQLSVVMVPIAAAVVASAGATSSRRALRIAPPALGLFLSIAVLVHGVSAWSAALSAAQPPSATLAALTTLDLPDDAIVLTNSYSEGTVQLTAGGTGVLFGRAPYTEARLLDRANALIASSQRFFAAPTAPGASMPCRGITHVLVAVDSEWRLGTSSVFPTDLAALDARGDLRRVATGPGFVLYEVVPDAEPMTTSVRCAAPPASDTAAS